METFPIPAPAFNGSSRVVAAGNAFEWLRQGWAIFVANPAQWLAMTLVFLVVFVGLNIVPFLGALVANLLMPVFSAGMLYAGRKVAEGDSLGINDLFAGFRQNTTPLLTVGVLYMAGLLVIAVLAAALGGMMLAMFLSLALSIPLLMAVWFAPALVFFNNMRPVEALKSSFSACLKNTLSFLVYGLVLMVLAFFAALPLGLGFLVLLPVIAGSVYVSYRDIFIAG